MKKNKIPQKINEISKSTVLAAAEKQEKLLNSSGYLKKISAWQYLRCIKRLEDFRKYAAGMVDAINSGNVGTPEDPTPKLADVNKAAADAIIKSENPAQTQTQTPAQNVPQKPVAPAVKKVDVKDIIIPKFPYASRVKPGEYTVTYKTTSDNIAHEWTNARSINGAIKNIITDTWDITEIISVVYDGPEIPDEEPTRVVDTIASSPVIPDTQAPVAEPVIDINAHDNLGSLGSVIAANMTDNQFNSMSELIADAHDDETTLECAEGADYVGTDLRGNEWSGPKSSYLKVYNSDPDKFNDDSNRDVTIVTQINESGDDDKIAGTFNLKAFKQALREGIVHFNYTKKTDGTERQAYGTTNQTILEENNATGTPGNFHGDRSHLISYYDMTQKGWRSCQITAVNTIYDESY